MDTRLLISVLCCGVLSCSLPHMACNCGSNNDNSQLDTGCDDVVSDTGAYAALSPDMPIVVFVRREGKLLHQGETKLAALLSQAEQGQTYVCVMGMSEGKYILPVYWELSVQGDAVVFKSIGVTREFTERMDRVHTDAAKHLKWALGRHIKAESITWSPALARGDLPICALEWWMILNDGKFPSKAPESIISPIYKNRTRHYSARLRFLLERQLPPLDLMPYIIVSALHAGFDALYPLAVARGLDYDGTGAIMMKSEMYGALFLVSNETIEKGIANCDGDSREARLLQEYLDAKRELGVMNSKK